MDIIYLSIKNHVMRQVMKWILTRDHWFETLHAGASHVDEIYYSLEYTLSRF
jgi:hypothetical protein